MSKYSDDFFREYEEIYSDSNKRNAERQTSGRSSDEPSSYRQNHYRAVDDRYRRSYRDASRRQTDRAAYGRNDHQRTVSGRSDYDTDGCGRSGSDRPSAAYRRPTTVNVRRGNQPKYRMTRRARRATILTVMILIVLGLLTGIIAIAVSVGGVGEVKSFAVSEVAAHQVTLSWEKAKNADGYRILAAKGAEDYTPVLTIETPETCTATLTELEQAQSYSFSVVSYRGQKEGKPVVLESISTLPDSPEITNIYSAKQGELHLDWSMNEKANGYLVEYRKDGGEYSADMTMTVSDPTECRANVPGLEVGATYFARVSAFVSAETQLNSAPSAELSVQIAAQDTPVAPKAPDIQMDSMIDPDKPMIALTFDDGPLDGGSGEKILDVLEQYNARATFFMVGCNVADHADNLKRKVQLKMELGNHTWNHAHYGNEVTPDDISMASNAIYDACGQYPTCFRSPGGMTTNGILTECAAEGMAAYYWTIDTQDWSSKNADSIYHEVMDYVKDGDIILMHEIYDSTADAVERMVPELIERGFQLVTCHDLIEAKTGADPVPGTQYASAYIQMDV